LIFGDGCYVGPLDLKEFEAVPAKEEPAYNKSWSLVFGECKGAGDDKDPVLKFSTWKLH